MRYCTNHNRSRWANRAPQARTIVTATLTRGAWARSALLLCDTALWTQHRYHHGHPLTRPSAVHTGVGGGGRLLWLQALCKRSDFARGIPVAAAHSKWTIAGARATGERVSFETQPGPVHAVWACYGAGAHAVNRRHTPSLRLCLRLRLHRARFLRNRCGGGRGRSPILLG